MSEPTWQAFWRTAVEGETPRDVAAALGLTAGAVYVYRNRVMARIRREIERYESDQFPNEGGRDGGGIPMR